MSATETKLLIYFLSDYSDRLSSAGSNDMNQAAFAGMTEVDRRDLTVLFDAWDQRANPEGWEARPFDWISDSSWAGFLLDRLKSEATR